jgi:hypothetical protein
MKAIILVSWLCHNHLSIESSLEEIMYKFNCKPEDNVRSQTGCD